MTSENKVEWCQGAPGAIPAFLSAAMLFKELALCTDPDEKDAAVSEHQVSADKYAEVARLAGEAVWSQGLLLKGNGLCEGITGNGYSLHSLARWYFRKAAGEVNDPAL